MPPMAEQINALRAGGKTVAEIAEIIGMSRSAVSTYLPYSRGSYVVGEKSKNALKIRKWRGKAERFVGPWWNDIR